MQVLELFWRIKPWMLGPPNLSGPFFLLNSPKLFFRQMRVGQVCRSLIGSGRLILAYLGGRNARKAWAPGFLQTLPWILKYPAGRVSTSLPGCLHQRATGECRVGLMNPSNCCLRGYPWKLRRRKRTLQVMKAPPVRPYDVRDSVVLSRKAPTAWSRVDAEGCVRTSWPLVNDIRLRSLVQIKHDDELPTQLRCPECGRSNDLPHSSRTSCVFMMAIII